MYADYDRIYKINQEFVSGAEGQMVSTTPSSLIPSLIDEIPEVETGTLIFDLSIFSSVLVDVGLGNQEENKFAYADHNFFQVFDLPLLSGNPALVLNEPNQIVLTESTAKRYFNSAVEATGKSLKVDGADYLVTGVMQDFPSNSHIDFDFLASFKTHKHGRNPEWSPSNYYSYVKFQEGHNLSEVKSKIDQLSDKYFGEAMKAYGFTTSFHLQPVATIHVSDNALSTIKPTIDIRYLYIFGLVGILLIFIGIINYVNLATAEATERNKEVGLRKVLGAGRSQLFGQFISESFLLTFSSLVFSILILFILASNFESLSGVAFDFNLLLSPLGILGIGLILIFVSLLSGFYPALILSNMEPLKALGKNIKIGGGAWLRKSLVVFQFFVSISLLISTIVVKNQLDYMQTVNLGYDREEIVALSYHYNMRKSIEGLKSEMLRTGAASQVTLAADMPIHIKAGYKIFPGGDNDKEIMITGYSVDQDIVSTLGLNILAGENFSKNEVSRTEAYEKGLDFSLMLNESAVRELGWTPEDAIGRKVSLGGEGLSSIKAVVEDFYFNSLHHQVGPLAIVVDPEQANVILAKLPKGNPSENLSKLEALWLNQYPDRPFNYKFVDQEYARMYRSEERVGVIFTVFAGIAVFIAIMGLFGLVSYVALRRTREISIRKVLGAKATDVLKVLSADFFSLLGVSAFLAVAFGMWFSQEWLEGFAYHAEVPVWVYLSAIFIVAAISFFTVGFRTVKVYRQDPAKTLKDD